MTVQGTTNIDRSATQTAAPAVHAVSTERNCMQRAFDTLSAGITHTRELGARYLRPSVLIEKVRNSIKAKLLPFSDPAGFASKIAAVQASIRVLRGIKKDLEDKLKLPSINTAVRAEQQALLEKTRTSLREKIEIKKSLIRDRNLQIGNRFGGLAGNVINAAVPGAGTLVSSAVTGAVIHARETNAANLPNTPITPALQRQTRIASYCTVICSVACLALSYYARPAITSYLFGRT